jgi:hypothetical protein
MKIKFELETADFNTPDDFLTSLQSVVDCLRGNVALGARPVSEMLASAVGPVGEMLPCTEVGEPEGVIEERLNTKASTTKAQKVKRKRRTKAEIEADKAAAAAAKQTQNVTDFATASAPATPEELNVVTPAEPEPLPDSTIPDAFKPEEPAMPHTEKEMRHELTDALKALVRLDKPAAIMFMKKYSIRNDTRDVAAEGPLGLVAALKEINDTLNAAM